MEGLGVAAFQHLEHMRTPLRNGDSGYFKDLIVAPPVPLLYACVNRLDVFEPVVALGVIGVYGFPRREDEDLGVVLVLREPRAQFALAYRRDVVEHRQSIKDASIKEDEA